MLISRRLIPAATLMLAAGFAHSVTPPTPTVGVGDKLQTTWTLPTTRTDGTQLPTSEIRSTNVYVESLASVINVNGVVTAYTYVLPVGVCIKTTDKIQATATDTSGLEGPASAPVYLATEACGPKSPPAAPVIKATVVKNTAP